MRNAVHEPEDSPSLKAMTERYRDSAVSPSRAVLDQGLRTVLSRLTTDRPRRARVLRWSLVGGTVAVLALFALRATSTWRHPIPAPDVSTLAYQVIGGSLLEGGYLRESGTSGVQVVFNEGSTFALTPGSRGRVRSVDKLGAYVIVESGIANVHVTPNLKRRWAVDVGPFSVLVKGTAFTVSWDPRAERFELDLRRGQVSVRGPVSAGEIAMRAGQRLVVSLPKAEAVISEGPQEQPVPATKAAAPRMEDTGERAEAAPVPEARSSRASARAGKGVGEYRWRDDLSRGDWARIVAEVERIGIDSTLRKASSEDLFAVADAARYQRRPDLARAALLAVRRRFPDAPRALTALFLLGRVEESREGGSAQAIAWYDDYLSRVRTGALVGEALGRKMILTDKSQGRDRARPIAEDYLRRFPSGSYADSARALLGVSGKVL